MARDGMGEWAHSPVLQNLVYWSFLAIVAYYVSPWILLILIFLPGFISDKEIEVSYGETTVRAKLPRDSVSEQNIRAIIEECTND